MSLESYIWFERYRPKTLEEMSLPKDYRVAFSQYIEDQSIPHLLLSGPAGSGKSTIAKVLTNHIPSVVLALNASGADRNIETVRTKITTFASSMQKGLLKVVLLEEANGLTADAQEALKDVIEKYNKSCRFVFTTNHPDKIVPAIQSRCMHYRFGEFPKKRLLKIVMGIIETEGVDAEIDDVQSIIDRHYPDVRTIFNEVQAASLGGAFKLSQTYIKVDLQTLHSLLKKGSVFSIREMVAGVTDFTFIYRFLFDTVLYEAKDREQSDIAMIAVTIRDSIVADSYVADREINFVNCLMQIMIVLGIDYKLDK